MDKITELFAIIHEKLTHWLHTAAAFLPNAVAAAAILFCTYFVSGWIRRLADRGLNRVIHNAALVHLLGTVVRFIAFAGGLILALNILALDRAVFSLLAGVGVIGLALGFAFQDMAANLISGVALVMKRDKPFKVGDLIETNGVQAFVTEINLRDTELRTFDGQAVFIPNSAIFKAQVKNYSLLGSRRVVLKLGVSYGDDLDEIERVLLEVVNGLPDLHPETKPDVAFVDFGDSAIDAQVRFWVKYPGVDVVVAKHRLIKGIKAAMDAHGLVIPFPIRTMDFDIRGGKTLASMLSAPLGAAPASKNGNGKSAPQPRSGEDS